MKQALVLILGCLFMVSAQAMEHKSCSEKSQALFRAAEGRMGFQLNKNGHVFEIYGDISSTAIMDRDSVRDLAYRIKARNGAFVADRIIEGVYSSFFSEGTVRGPMTVYELKDRTGRVVRVIEAGTTVVFVGDEASCQSSAR